MFPRECYIYCATVDEAEELLGLLEQDGFRWNGPKSKLPTEEILFRPGGDHYRLRKDNRLQHGGVVDYDWPIYYIDDAREFAGIAPVGIHSIADLL